MILYTRTQGIALTDELATHIDRQVRFALTRFAGRITRIHVQVENTEGPTQGALKECRIRVGLRSRGSLVVKEHDQDVFSAVARAADRLGHAVARHLDRVRGTRRTRETRIIHDAV